MVGKDLLSASWNTLFRRAKYDQLIGATGRATRQGTLKQLRRVATLRSRSLLRQQ